MIGHVLAAQGQIGGVLATGRRPGGAGFSGAYDAIPSIVAAYGMRRLLTAYIGPILRLRRSSDSTEQDIGATAAGDLDTAAVAAFVGAGSGFVRTWYDQSGNAYNANQATPANQPLYVASGQNGRPVGRWDGADDILAAIPAAGMLSVSFFMVAKWLSGGASEDLPLCVGVSGTAGKLRSLYRRSSGATLGFATWSIDISSSTHNLDIGTAYYLWEATQSGTSVVLGKDGNTTAHTLPGTPTTTSANIYIGGISPATGYFSNLDIAELIICNAALSDANRQAAEAAANNYWAIF